MKLRQDGDWELIQNALGAFPPDIGALMTTATERHEDTIDMDDMIPASGRPRSSATRCGCSATPTVAGAPWRRARPTPIMTICGRG